MLSSIIAGGHTKPTSNYFFIGVDSVIPTGKMCESHLNVGSVGEGLKMIILIK